MAIFQAHHPMARLAVVSIIAAAVCLAGAALASQGPGAGPGTASRFTQLAMALIVYGTCAILILCGLIAAARRAR